MTSHNKTPQDIKSERRIRNNRIRRKREMRKHFLMLMATLFLIVVCSVAVSSFRSSAKNDSKASSYKYYKSISVSNSDTLWSIANTYMDESHYESVQAYIREVMQINRLTSDAIYADTHLIVPYFEVPDK